VRGLKLLSEPCFCYLKETIISQHHSLPTLQISLGIVALFEKIYDGERFLDSLYELVILCMISGTGATRWALATTWAASCTTDLRHSPGLPTHSSLVHGRKCLLLTF
jgi:hypothetical protein